VQSKQLTAVERVQGRRRAHAPLSDASCAPPPRSGSERLRLCRKAPRFNHQDRAGYRRVRPARSGKPTSGGKGGVARRGEGRETYRTYLADLQ